MKKCALCDRPLEGGTYITMASKPGKPHFCVSCAGNGVKNVIKAWVIKVCR